MTAERFRLVGLDSLLAATEGSPAVVVGVIDGPADLTHPDLGSARIGTPHGGSCRYPSSAACLHGTAVVGLLAARRDSPVPGLCPGCTVLLRPVFCEAAPGSRCPALTPAELATAIVDVVAAGARIVNLSLGVHGHPLARSAAVDDAFDHARDSGVLVVVAAGNHGHVGPAPLMTHRWPLVVASCDDTGRPLPDSNLGISIGRAGLRAPGLDIATLAPGGGYQRIGGTSAAAPFVTGAAALLWSLAPDLTAAEVRAALARPGAARRSIVPPLLNAAASLQVLGGYRTGCTS